MISFHFLNIISFSFSLFFLLVCWVSIFEMFIDIKTACSHCIEAKKKNKRKIIFNFRFNRSNYRMWLVISSSFGDLHSIFRFYLSFVYDQRLLAKRNNFGFFCLLLFLFAFMAESLAAVQKKQKNTTLNFPPN